MSRLSPKEFAELMADWANGACFEDMDDVACHIVSRTHRTLQQQVFALFLAMVQQWLKCENTGQFDARNQFTVEKSKEMAEKVLEGYFTVPLI